MSLIYKKNQPNWSYQSMRDELKIFDKIYENRPIKNNHGGGKFPQMFATYFILKKIKPDFVVESGILKGQSTWLIETTLPKAKILSIDINLNQRVYISKSKNITYSSVDFINHDFSNIPRNSLIFFDDHQNAFERLFFAYGFNFKNVIFEDNYPITRGDCYSLKKIYHGSGHTQQDSNFIKKIKELLAVNKYLIRKLMNNNYKQELFKLKLSMINDIYSNKNHFKMIDKIISSYYEFPPIFKTLTTRWGDKWDNKKYPTEKPILNLSERKRFKLAFEENKNYNFICYVKLK